MDALQASLVLTILLFVIVQTASDITEPLMRRVDGVSPKQNRNKTMSEGVKYEAQHWTQGRLLLYFVEF